MNWKKLFLIDLGALLTGRAPAPEAERIAGMWFRGPFRREHRLTPPALPQTPMRPRAYYRGIFRRSMWPGPRYVVRSHRQRHQVTVLSELAAMVRTNVPLCTGLEHSAWEQQRTAGSEDRPAVRAARLAMRLLLIVLAVAIVLQALMPGIGQLVLAGIPAGLVVAAVASVVAMRRGQEIEAVFLVLRDRLASGMALSEAMRSLPRVFDPYQTDLVEAGERSGALAATLDGLARRAIEQQELRRGVGGAVAYLAALALAHLLLGAFIAIKVAPVFVEIAEEFSSDLPVRAAILDAVRYFPWSFGSPLGILFHGTLGAALLIALLYALDRRASRRAHRRGEGRPRRFAALAACLPGVGGAIVAVDLSRACGVLHLLAGAGVPLHEGLDRVSRLGILPRFQRGFASLRDGIVQGAPLSETLRARGARFPAAMANLLVLGETSGRLPESMAFLADYYTLRARMRLRLMADLVLPVGVLMCGALTLGIEWLCFGAIVEIIEATVLASY